MRSGADQSLTVAKIIAAAACVDFDPWEFFSKKTPIEKALPVIDVLTLAATGTEMDDCAVISNPETVDKMGAASPALIPEGFLHGSSRYLLCSGLSDGSGSVQIF